MERGRRRTDEGRDWGQFDRIAFVGARSYRTPFICRLFKRCYMVGLDAWRVAYVRVCQSVRMDCLFFMKEVALAH